MHPIPSRGEFGLTLDNKGTSQVVKLKFSYESMARMEERIGHSLVKLAVDVRALNIRMRPIFAVVYESYLEARPEGTKFTEAELGQMLLDSGFVIKAKDVMTFVMTMLSSGKEEIPEGKGVTEATPPA